MLYGFFRGGFKLENRICIKRWSERYRIIRLFDRFKRQSYNYNKILKEEQFYFLIGEKVFRVLFDKTLKEVYIDTETPELLFKLYKILLDAGVKY